MEFQGFSFSVLSLSASAFFGTFWALFFNFFNYFLWLRITDEGSIPEMRIWSILLIKSDLKWCIHLKLHSHQTADQPPTNADQFLWLGRVWSGKNYPLWLKSVSIPDQRPLYPRCIPDAPTLKSRSSRPTPVLPADQSPLCTTNLRPIPDTTTLTTLNIGPTPDLISIPGKWIIQSSVRA